MKNDIPFTDFGGNGEVLHLAHANGFPIGCYRKLAVQLSSNNRVIGMNARPLWKGSDPLQLTSWAQMADDLIEFLDAQGRTNVIGVGHSMGAISTLIAANKRPELFSKLVLIEPVVLPSTLLFGASLLPIPLVKKLLPVVKTALNRTDTWTDREKVFAHFRTKPVFAKIPDDILRNYIEYGTRKAEDGSIRLAYPKEWEAQVFATVANPWSLLKAPKHPILAIRGQHSDVITPEVWNRWKSVGSQTTFVELPELGHMVPLEDPQLLVSHIHSFLQN